MTACAAGNGGVAGDCAQQLTRLAFGGPDGHRLCQWRGGTEDITVTRPDSRAPAPSTQVAPTGAHGRRTDMMVPGPAAPAAVMVPPCAAITWAAMLKPGRGRERVPRPPVPGGSLEDSRQDLQRDPDSIIANPERRLAILDRQRHFDGATVRRIFDRIVDQVLQHALHALAVAPHARGVVWQQQVDGVTLGEPVLVHLRRTSARLSGASRALALHSRGWASSGACERDRPAWPFRACPLPHQRRGRAVARWSGWRRPTCFSCPWPSRYCRTRARSIRMPSPGRAPAAARRLRPDRALGHCHVPVRLETTHAPRRR